MATPLKKNSPIWLAKQDPNDPKLSPSYKRSVIYYRKLYQAWPDWISEDSRFNEIYKEAKERRKAGEDVHVDHIVPICSDIVCGLHVPWNLAIVSAKYNMSKSNLHWPDMPFEQLTLF